MMNETSTLTISELRGGNWEATQAIVPYPGPLSWFESFPSPAADLHVMHPNGAFVAKVGMGCTEYMYTDRRAYTVVWVSPSGKTCRVQADTATRVDGNGMSDCQDYTYTPDPEGEVVTLRLGKRGWASKGRRFGMGHRRAYHDYSF